jgi:isocitrate dehydrogenase
VQQFVAENYLRWDSPRRVPGPGGVVRAPGDTPATPRAKVLADTLDAATSKYLSENDKSPARKVGQLDNRGSHFYLALYWAEALAAQTDAV